ncbi:MAG: C-GCAxxG-C-C family protein [Clostridia bacterium]|nr:C-GCAxxG-C-C family protein [Clostridia bacterium]
MSNHIEKAMELRNAVPCKNNCAQTVVRVFAEEIGLDPDKAAALVANFGGGMKCGKTCGAICGGLVVLGAKGVTDGQVINQYMNAFEENHNGMTDCEELLSANMKAGKPKSEHCNGLICEAIELVEKLSK